jgi:hypothetical protein
MNPSKLFLTLGAAAALSFRAEAAISVTGAGAGPFDFSAPPASPADFSTLSVGGASATFETVAGLDAAVMTRDATTVIMALVTQTANPPDLNGGLAKYNSTLQALVTRPTGNDYTLLMATLVNNAGTTIYKFKLKYDYATNNVASAVPAEAIPGQRVFFSTSGAPGSWLLLSTLSGLTTTTPGANAIVNGISWPAGGNAYVLWADDNSQPNDDWGNVIDNLAITEVSTTIEPTTIAITSPANNFSIAVCADLTVATATTGPITNVVFLVDGVAFTNDTTLPFGGTVTVPLSISVGPHTLTAKATDNTGAMVTSAPITINVLANTPPTLNITNTFSGTITGTTFLVGSEVTVQAGFSDDDVITNISWYVDNVLYITNRINGTWTYADSLAGTHVLKGIASDRKGNMGMATRTITVTNPPASYTLLVTNGSEWRYFVTSTAEPTDPLGVQPWYSPFFDDTGIDWASGFAELGNGDTADGYPERTMIDIGPAGMRYNAMYFRKTFNVGNPALYPTVVLRLLRDDGAVVYLNGIPVWTNNMTPTAFPVPYADLAANAGDEGLVYQILNLPNPSGDAGLVSGDNLVAVEVHQSAITSSDLSFDMMIWGTAIPNQLPTVTLTNPPAGSNLLVGTFVLVGASASDPDGAVAEVNFYDNGILWFTDTAAPYQFTLSDLTVGAHTISAVAVDNSGSNSLTSSVMIMVTNPPALTAIVTNGSDWKYLDTGVDQLTAWHALGFDDSTWATGFAELGYGDAVGDTRPERTVVSFGPDMNAKYRTTYFRKKVNVTAPIEFGRLRLDSLRDDGVVVYINGNEVFRNNFTNTTTPILFGDFADVGITGADEETYLSANVAASVLVPGMNIIAVEMHQNSTNSSDISFDLMLWGTGPELRISHVGANAVVQWNTAPNYHLEQSSNISSPANWAAVPGNPSSPFTTPLPAAPSQRFYRLRHN